MRRAAPALAVVVLVLAALGIVAAVLGGGRRGAPRQAALRGAGEGGATLVLYGVDVDELRPDGSVIRLRSDRASYAVLRRDLTAEKVTVALPSPAGEIAVEAPRAFWDMDAGIVRLPEGGRAAVAGGWSAVVPEARLDLAAREMTAGGASVAGPGVALEGRDLVWRWKDGMLTLDAARGRVLPAKTVRRHG